jgi:hypothetical protein
VSTHVPLHACGDALACVLGAEHGMLLNARLENVCIIKICIKSSGSASGKVRQMACTDGVGVTAGSGAATGRVARMVIVGSLVGGSLGPGTCSVERWEAPHKRGRPSWT